MDHEQTPGSSADLQSFDVNNNDSQQEGGDLQPPPKKQKVQGENEGTVESAEVSHFKLMGEKLKKAEKVGDVVHEDLAQSINELFTCGMGDETFKALNKEVARPENCLGLREVRTNPLVWKLLSSHAQDVDSRLRGVQMSVCRATSVLAFLLDEMNGLQDNEPTELGKKFLDKGMEVVGLLGHANANLNWRRREIMRPEIDRDYGSLCSQNTKVTEWLFGDDVSGDLKDIQTVNKAQSRLRGRGRGNFRSGFRGGRARGGFRGYPNFNSNYNPSFSHSRGRFQNSWAPRRGRGQQRGK